MTRETMRIRRETRLRVLNALPQSHQDYFCAEIRKLCAKYVAALSIPAADRDSETADLLSEAIAKLLGATVQHEPEPAEAANGAIRTDPPQSVDPEAIEDAEDETSPLPTVWAVDDKDPARDGRVAWLIQEVGGRQALSHRYEDMRRQRWGRWRDTGYRTVQMAALPGANSDAEGDDDTLARNVDPSHPLRAELEDPGLNDDNRRAWEGLVILAESQFDPESDAAALLNLLAEDDDIQAGFGSEWPIRQIVEALNIRRPVLPWSDGRVENAKRRLKNWIKRLATDYGLDTVDLMALFARCAREYETRASSKVRPIAPRGRR